MQVSIFENLCCQQETSVKQSKAVLTAQQQKQRKMESWISRSHGPHSISANIHSHPLRRRVGGQFSHKHDKFGIAVKQE